MFRLTSLQIVGTRQFREAPSTQESGTGISVWFVAMYDPVPWTLEETPPLTDWRV